MMLYIVIHENLIRNLKILVTFHRNGFVYHAAYCVVAVVVVGFGVLGRFCKSACGDCYRDFRVCFFQIR